MNCHDDQCQLGVQRRDGGGNRQEPQGTAVKVMAVLQTVGWHEDSGYGQDHAEDGAEEVFKGSGRKGI